MVSIFICRIQGWFMWNFFFLFSRVIWEENLLNQPDEEKDGEVDENNDYGDDDNEDVVKKK